MPETITGAAPIPEEKRIDSDQGLPERDQERQTSPGDLVSMDECGGMLAERHSLA